MDRPGDADVAADEDDLEGLVFNPGESLGLDAQGTGLDAQGTDEADLEGLAFSPGGVIGEADEANDIDNHNDELGLAAFVDNHIDDNELGLAAEIAHDACVLYVSI